MLAYKTLSKSALFSLFGFVLLFPPLKSVATEWSAQPSVSAGTNYNDNINLQPGPHDAVWGYSLTPNLTLAARAAQWVFSGHAQINRLDYPGHTTQSRTDHLLDLSYTRQNELNQWQLTGSLTRDSALFGELALTGVPLVAQRSSRALTPAWSRSLTERDTLTMKYGYQAVAYREAVGSSLQDYTTRDPSIVLKHTFTEKNSLNFSLGYSDYKTENPATLNNGQYHFITKSAELGFDRTFSQTLSGTITVGLHKSDSTFTSLTCAPIPFDCFPVEETSSSTSSGSLLNAQLQKTFESSTLTTHLSRSLQPTGDGGLFQTDQVSAAYNAALSERLRSALYLSVYSSQRINSSFNSSKNRYYNITPSLSWQLSELWSSTMSYSYAVSRVTSGAEAKSNAINLTINYNWPRITRSR